jgi:hypothetical protein
VTRVRERHVALAWALGGVLLAAAALRQWRRSLRDERWG